MSTPSKFPRFSFCTALFLVIQTGFLFAQAPQAFQYQAQARDNAGKVLANKVIKLRANIVSNSPSGALEYSEIHTDTTDEQGVFALALGTGTPQTGTFAAIDWATGNKWLKIEMDAEGGNNFVMVGASQLLSVPYALYAEKAGSAAVDPGINADGSIVDIAKSSSFDNKNIVSKSIGSDASISSTFIDEDTNIYLIGSVRTTLTMKSTTIQKQTNGLTYFVAKLDKEGEMQWLKGFAGDIQSSPSYFLTEGNLLITFISSGSPTYDGQILANGSPSVYDNHVFSIRTSDGSLNWKRQFVNTGINYGPLLVRADANTVYTTGRYTKNGFQLGSKTLTGTGNYLAQLDKTNGNILWSYTITNAGPNSSSNYLTDLNVSTDNLYFLLNLQDSVTVSGQKFGASQTSLLLFSLNKSGNAIENPIKTAAPLSGGGKVLPMANNLFISASNSGGGSWLRKVDFVNDTIAWTVVLPYVSLFADPALQMLYTSALNKYNTAGQLVSTKQASGLGGSTVTGQLTPLNDGTCYYASSQFQLGTIIFNLPSTSYLLLHYDLATETIKEQILIKSYNCTYSQPLVLGKRRYLFSTGGIIKSQGKVNTGLVFVQF